MASIIKNTMPLSHGACQICAEELAQMHHPIQIDYRKFFNVPEPQDTAIIAERQADYNTEYEEEVIDSYNGLNQVNSGQIEFLTLPKIAKKLQISKDEFTAQLHQQGYLEKKNEYDYLTSKGKISGIRFKKGRYGFYFLFPTGFIPE
jgi:hypothetical protein